jgi:hypothetical protein
LVRRWRKLASLNLIVRQSLHLCFGNLIVTSHPPLPHRSIPAVVFGTLAVICERRRSLAPFISLAVIAWAAAILFAAIAGNVSTRVAYVPTNSDRLPRETASTAGLAIIPIFALSFCVFGVIARRSIPLVAFASVLVALPFTAYLSQTASCYILHRRP